MKRTVEFLFIVGSFLCFNRVVAQVGVGSWRDYLPYANITIVQDAGDVIYGATPYSILEVEKTSGEFYRLSKITGLTETGVSAMGFHKQSQTLFIGYENGNIDLIEGGNIMNVADVLRANIIADKRINNVHFYRTEAFISCGFGIVRYDMLRQEVRDTYYIGADGSFLNVNDLTVLNDTIYAATDAGIKKAFVDDPFLADYSVWQIDTNIAKPSVGFKLIESNADRMLALENVDPTIQDTAYEFDGSSWNVVPQLQNMFIRSLRLNGDSLILSRDGFVQILDTGYNVLRLDADYGSGKTAEPNDAIIDEDGLLWVGDRTFGIIKTPETFNYTLYNPEGPRTNNVEELSFRGSDLMIATGGKTESWTNAFLVDGVFYREGNSTWGEYSSRFIPALDPIRDFIRLAVNPRNEDVFMVASLGKGVLEFNGDNYLGNFDDTNSTLQLAVNSFDFVGVTDVTYDDDGNLWVANSLTNRAIHVYTKESEWYSYDFANLLDVETTGDLLVTSSGLKWLTLPNKGLGILVFDDGGTIDNTADDQARIINSSSGSGGLPSSNIYSIVEDLEGEIWVGTDQGVGVFYSPNSVFDNVNFDAQRPLVELDGFLQYLLESEIVTCIAVDAANRKWFGTENSGVFLMNAQGTEEILHFTEDNSPLLSDKIKTIAVNPEDGEVLIGTDQGLIAFRGTATESSANYSNVLAFPNPVEPDYTGVIAIKGLAINSYVKITDITGNLVFETYSEGGQAIWNGKQMGGDYVSPGVYLVFASDDEGVESEVTKILMMR